MHLLFSGRAGFKQAWEGADAAKNAKKPRQVKVPAALPPTTGVVHNWMKSYQAAGSGGGMPDGGMPGGGGDAPGGAGDHDHEETAAAQSSELCHRLRELPNQNCAPTEADDSSSASSTKPDATPSEAPLVPMASRTAAPTTTGVPANSMES